MNLDLYACNTIFLKYGEIFNDSKKKKKNIFDVKIDYNSLGHLHTSLIFLSFFIRLRKIEILHI